MNIKPKLGLNPIPHGGGGGQILPALKLFFFITSVRDVTKLQNLVTFLKFYRKYDFEYKNDKSYPESSDMTIFGKSLVPKGGKISLILP